MCTQNSRETQTSTKEETHSSKQRKNLYCYTDRPTIQQKNKGTQNKRIHGDTQNSKEIHKGI
jgi:hypothetical protein